MPSFYETARADSDRALSNYGTQAETYLRSKRASGEIPDLSGRMATAKQNTLNWGGREIESYNLFRQWVYTSVNYVAKRLAGQPWSAGELKNAEPKKNPQKTYGLSVRQPWLKNTVPTNMLRRSAPGQDLDVFQTHAILDTIDRPNPLQRRSEFMYMSVVSLLLTGVAYWVGGRVKGKRGPNDKQAEGDKIEVWAIPSWLVTPIHKDGLFSHYKVRMGMGDTAGEEIPAANVARTYLPDPSDLTAVYSPLNACIRAIKTDEHIQGSQEGLFARGLMPHHAVIIGKDKEGNPPPFLQGASRRQVERTVMDLYWRPLNDGFPAIFDGLISDIKRLDPMPREMDWKVSGEIVRDRILRTYGINLLLLGDTQGGNRAQAVMAEENAASNVFNPLADTFTETACEWLAPMFEPEQRNSRIWVWVNQFVAHDEEMAQREWDAARNRGDVTRNETRAERLHLQPLEDEPEPTTFGKTPGIGPQVVAIWGAVSQSQADAAEARALLIEMGATEEAAERIVKAREKKEPPPQMPGAPGQPPFGAPTGAPAPGTEAEPSPADAEEPDATAPAEKMHGAKSIPAKYDHLNFSVTDAMVTAAKQGLAWREEFNRGGTQVGVARANQIINDKTLTPDTWRRVKAYFDRHQSDREAEGWSQGETGFPSAGRIAHELWGGDAGYSRSKKIVSQINAADEEEASDKAVVPGGVKYNPDQPRDDAGRFGEGGGGSSTGDSEPRKRPAEARGESVGARVEGSGKDKKVLLEDGSEAPKHIQEAGIPPAWENVRVYTDPDSEVWVEAKHTTQRGIESPKKIYNPSYEAEQQAAKHVRIEQMMKEDAVIKDQIQDGLKNPETKEEATVALLMDQQATRPGSEKDTKGLAKYYGKPVVAEDVIVTPPEPDKKGRIKGDPKVELKVGDDTIHIRDKGTASELIKRKEAGEGLEDTTYWLKSHGATTLESRHVVEEKDGVHLKFVGKEGVFHDHVVKDPELANALVERAKTANERGGKLFDTDDGKVQAYVKSLDTGRFTPKDFRTKRATELALDAVKQYAGKTPKDAKERQTWIMDVSSKASRVLGNQAKQCFETYINPHVWDAIPKAAA